MLTPNNEKIKNLKAKYLKAVEKERKVIEKSLIDFSNNLVEIALKDEKFNSDFLAFLKKDNLKNLDEKFVKILIRCLGNFLKFHR